MVSAQRFLCRSAVLPKRERDVIQRHLREAHLVAAGGAAGPMPKQPLLSKRGAGQPSVPSGAVEGVHRQPPQFMLLRVTLGLLAIMAAYELVQFALGSCQGYSGVAAFERSIIGQYFELWSVDPMRCQ